MAELAEEPMEEPVLSQRAQGSRSICQKSQNQNVDNRRSIFVAVEYKSELRYDVVVDVWYDVVINAWGRDAVERV